MVNPNPSKGSFEVNLTFSDLQKHIEISISTLSGNRILYKQLHYIFGNSRVDINIGQYPAGMYILEVKYDDGIMVEKIILNK